MNELKERMLCNASANAIALVGILATFVQFAQAGEQPAAYVMTVIQDRAQGDQLVQGAYSEAIENIMTRKSRDRFAVSNNLCVAYAKTNKLEEAEKACSTALKNGKSFSGNWHRAGNRTDDAIALSNRGVVRAIAGDTELARQDFREAMKLTSSLTAPAENLAVLEAKTAETLSAL